MKLIRRLIPIIGLILVFTPGVLRRGFQIPISRPVYIGVISLGMLFSIISMVLKKEK